MDYSWHCDELEKEGARFVHVARGAEDVPVPTCPEWRVPDLLAHVGFVHRWSEYVVRHRAQSRPPTRDMGLSRGPVDPDWIALGLADLLATLRASDPEESVWAWGADQHVRFWARRQLHETLVHRVDLEGARGRDSVIDDEVAADAIDEFLANLTRAGDFSPGVKNLVGTGETIVVATDEGRQWAIRLLPEGFDVDTSTSPTIHGGDVATLRGSASEVLLVMYRRRTLEESSCTVEGRRDVVTHWLAHSALL